MTKPTKSEMRAAILDLVKRYPDGVTFAQIQDLPGGHGDHRYQSGDRNLIWWDGLSTAAAEALRELRASKRVFSCPVWSRFTSRTAALSTCPWWT